MSEQMLHDDALEQQLRAHYASEFGQPPSPATIWMSLQGELHSPPPEKADSVTPHWWRPARTHSGTVLPSHILQGRVLRPRSAMSHSLLPVAAAALLIAVFAAVLLGPFGRAYFGRTGGISTPTPTDAPATATPEVPAGYAVHELKANEMWPGARLYDLQMLSSDEGWAIGVQRTSASSTPFESAILHYAHGRWTASPDVFPNVSLSSISMLSPDEGWAGGVDSASGNAALLHYSDGHWRSAPTPDHGAILQISMLTPSDGWATQLAQDTLKSTSPRFALLHFDGTAWSPADTAGMQLITLSMLSPSEGWAAGEDGVIAHFQHGKWTRWPTKAPSEVDYITMVSPTDGWMSGLVPGPDIEPTNYSLHHIFMLHYDGGDWRPVTFPTLPDLRYVYSEDPNATTSDANMPSALAGISMVSSTEGWAAGDIQGRVSTLYHYSSGKWQLSPFAVNQSLSKIKMVSAGEGWAIGASRYVVNDNEAAVILHYVHGAWTIYKP